MTALALAAIVALLAINGFFVAAEFALVSVRPGQVTGAGLTSRLARRQHEHLDAHLAACQLGITIASLALGAIGEPTFARLLEPALHSLPLAHAAAVLGSILALMVMTALHITVGEQAPKSFAIGSAPITARFCAVPLAIFYTCLRPLVLALNAVSNGIVRAFGGTPASSHASNASLEELRTLIGGLARAGELGGTEQQLLSGVFTLDERHAEDVMTPRARVTYVQQGQAVEEALRTTRDTGHSRFPVFDATGERLVGVVYVRELLDALLDDRGGEPVSTFQHAMFVSPPRQALDELLARMQEGRVSIAAVVDEHGRVEGVVTIEDIVEEIVGEIWDEDDVVTGIRRLPNGRVVCRGDVSLADLERYGITVDSEKASSIGGAIQHELGRVPVRGDVVKLGDVRAQVVDTVNGRVDRVVLG